MGAGSGKCIAADKGYRGQAPSPVARPSPNRANGSRVRFSSPNYIDYPSANITTTPFSNPIVVNNKPLYCDVCCVMSTTAKIILRCQRVP